MIFLRNRIAQLKSPVVALISFLKAVLVASLLTPVCFVQASDFQIQPTALELNSNVKSGVLSVINNGNKKLNVQISVMEWTQDATGKDVYGETQDIVFFPKIMTVEPEEQRAIRIGLKGRSPLQERTYRIFIEEIPAPKKPSGEKPSEKIIAELTIAFRYAIPIFAKPVRLQERGIVEKLEMSRGAVKASIRNTGSIHIKLLKVKLRGKDTDGKELFSKEIAGWYVLQGMSRSYEAAVPREVCENLAKFEIVAEAENFNINGTLNVQKEMCTQ